MYSIKTKNGAFAVCALISLCFLFIGSEYISWWLYKLPLYFGSTASDLLSEGAGYLLQALGILIFFLIAKKRLRSIMNFRSFTALVVIDVISAAVAFFAPNGTSVLIFGFIMNLMHGMIGAYYLTRLCLNVPQQKRGLTFGAAYAVGSVGTWLLSLVMQGGFLGSPYVFIAYTAMLFAAVITERLFAAEPKEEKIALSPLSTSASRDFAIPLAAAVVVLLTVVKGLGFYFPTSDHIDSAVNAEAARAFYAVGLIAAGIVNDKSRRLGAIGCLCALVFPFIVFALMGEPSTAAALWISGYIFTGFFVVYRTVTFVDIAGKKEALLPLACFGLMFGRIGDAAGTFGGVAMKNSLSCLVIVSAVLFVLTILLFFKLYNKTYAAVPQQSGSPELLLHCFEKRYAFTARETEVFSLIINGRSNPEIAAELYVSESTVKFHVKNLLRKTKCSNRAELIAKYKGEAAAVSDGLA